MVGKQLSALLQILRSAGVTSYETPQIKLTLGPPPPPRTARAIDLSPEALANEHPEVDDEEPKDWRFALERRMSRYTRGPSKPKADAQ